MAVFIVLVIAVPQPAAAEEVVDTSTVARHDATETGEVDTAYFRYH
jgi:hypothetical protein